MTFLDLLAFKKLTIYSLSRKSGVAKTTLNDLATGKRDLGDAKGKTLLAISKTLNVSIEELLSLEKDEAKSTLPTFLNDSIYEFRKAVRTDSTLIDCYADQLNSSLNVCDVEDLLPKDQLERIRNRYFEDHGL